MLRKLSIIPTLAAMLMVMFVTFVPHHHHQAMICLVHETCEADGCVNDEHTGHSDANHEEDERRMAEKQAAREREKRMQKAAITIQKRFGKNALLRGTDFQEGATMRDRNGQVGGHKG